MSATLRPVFRQLAAAVITTWCVSASAQEFVVRDIRVEGVQRTEAGTVYSYLPIRVGDRFDPERGTQALIDNHDQHVTVDLERPVQGCAARGRR